MNEPVSATARRSAADPPPPRARPDQIEPRVESLEATLQRIAELTKHALPGVDEVSMTVIEADLVLRRRRASRDRPYGLGRARRGPGHRRTQTSTAPPPCRSRTRVSVERIAQLQAAMATRPVIEQAKGIIMGRDGCSSDEAFALLVRMSQNQNIELRDVAETLIRAANR